MDTTAPTIVTIFIKVIKVILNFIILMLYRYGYGGLFLGVGGTWNLNEEKNADAEIIASGVMVGFCIYTVVVLISFCFGSTKHKESIVDNIMNVVGTFMFVGVGAVALHYWSGYQPEDHSRNISSEKQVGLALGSLCIILSAVYLLDTVLSFVHIGSKIMRG